MPLCLALRHIAFEDLGMFGPALAGLGYGIDYVEVPVQGVDPAAILAADLVVALGGPVSVYQADRFPWLAAEADALGARLRAGRPTLGLCLGAQLMAHALGAVVEPGPAPEIGWSALDLTEEGLASPLALIDRLPVLHWHGDGFAMPSGAKRLASTSAFPNQAFMLGTHALALQFHPEVDPDRFEWWLVANDGQLASLGLEPEQLRAETRRNGERLRPIIPELLKRWLTG